MVNNIQAVSELLHVFCTSVQQVRTRTPKTEKNEKSEWSWICVLQLSFLRLVLCVLNAILTNISVISRLSILLVYEIGVPIKDHWISECHWHIVCQGWVEYASSWVAIHNCSRYMHWLEK